jgi:hypothetical protein
MPRVHSEVEVLYGTLFQPLCENNAGRDAFRGRDVEMTSDERFVTCPRCLKALGYAVAA